MRFSSKSSSPEEEISKEKTQRACEKRLVKSYGLQPSGADIEKIPCLCKDHYWNHAIGAFDSRLLCVIEHLFPHRRSPTVMRAIFGADAENELFSPHNGLVIQCRIRSNLKAGLLVIVPDLPQDATEEQHRQWQLFQPKDYVFKVLSKTDSELEDIVALGEESSITLRDLDGCKLQWRNDFRPRAKYMYYLYCLNVLRYVWKHREGDVEPSIRQRYWGHPEKYIRPSMIRCLIEKVGHGIEDFLDAGQKDDGWEETAENDTELLKALAETVATRMDRSSTGECSKALRNLSGISSKPVYFDEEDYSDSEDY